VSSPTSRWRLPVVTATVALLASACAVPLPAAADSPAKPAPTSAFYEASPLETAAIPAGSTYTNLNIGGSEPLAYAHRKIRVADEPGAALRLEVFEAATGKVNSTFDLTGQLDVVDAATHVNNYDKDQRLEIFVRGSLAGQARLLRIVGTAKDSLTGAMVQAVDSVAIDPSKLVLLDVASSGLLAVHRDDDGSFTAQRVSYDLVGVRDPVKLPLADAGAREFVMTPGSGNLFSIRDGAVDVVSVYDVGTLRSAALPAIAGAMLVRADGDRVVIADEGGDVALVSAEFMGDPVVDLALALDAMPRSVDVKDAFDELQVVTADGASIRRFPVDGAPERETRVFDGLSIVEGSLSSGSWSRNDSSFLAVAADQTFRYVDSYLLAPTPFVSQISSPETVGAPMTWSTSAFGTGNVNSVWEYSLDGGANWSERGQDWSQAVPDAGDTLTDRPALPAALDGKAPYFRSSTDELALASWSFGRGENAISVPTSGYSALWRARFFSELGSITGPVQKIAVATPPAQSPAPLVTKHPAPARAVDGRNVSFEASATGDPVPAVRWERSSDGASWAAVAGATTTKLSVRAALVDSGTRYRAVFTSSAGEAVTEAAVLTVTPVPAPSLGAAPAGAKTIAGAAFNLDLNDYGADWRRESAGEHVKVAKSGVDFGSGNGWRDPATGAFQAVWQGSATFLPYGGLNGLHLTFANPYLAIDAAGRGTVTADVSWNNGGGMGGTGGNRTSDGSQRVVIATFAESAVELGADGAYTFTGAPEWAGRSYVKPELADARTYLNSFPASFVDYLDDDLRPWFLSTGSSRDDEKAPRELVATFTATEQAAVTTGDPVSASDPLGDGAQHFTASAPVFTMQPVSTTSGADGSARFEVAASGVPAPRLQWQRLDGDQWRDIDGATTPVLEITGFEGGTASLRVTAQNSVGKVVSKTVTLTSTTPQPSPEPSNPVEPSPEPSNPVEPSPEPSGRAPSSTPAAPVAEGAELSSKDTGGLSARLSGESLSVSGLAPGKWYHLTAYSAPTSLGWKLADASGTVTAVLPESIGAGAHRVAVQDSTGVLVGWAGFEVPQDGAYDTRTVTTVPAEKLANTGFDGTFFVIIFGAGFVALGVILSVIRVRGRKKNTGND
jgi:hypothetical protein